MKTSLLTFSLFALAVCCSKTEAPPREQTPAAPVAPAAPAAPAPPAAKAVDFSKVDKMIAAAGKPEDFEAIYGDCAGLGLQTLAAKKLAMKDAESDPDYWRHCKVDPTRAEVQVVLKQSKQSKKGKIHPGCGLAAMNAHHIADSARPEAAEFKKLLADMAKPCDL